MRSSSNDVRHELRRIGVQRAFVRTYGTELLFSHGVLTINPNPQTSDVLAVLKTVYTGAGYHVMWEALYLAGFKIQDYQTAIWDALAGKGLEPFMLTPEVGGFVLTVNGTKYGPALPTKWIDVAHKLKLRDGANQTEALEVVAAAGILACPSTRAVRTDVA